MNNPQLPLKYRIKISDSVNENRPCIFLLHGYGSNEDDLFSFASYFPKNYTIISFRAPIELDMGGYAWSNIQFNDSGEKNTILIEAKKSVKFIKESIELSTSYFNLDSNDISLIGFSQGCILSWALAMSYPNLIRRAATLSGYIIPEIVNAPLKNVSNLIVFNSHGVLDQIIPIEKARQSFNLIKENNSEIIYKEYNEGHGISEENFSDLLNWLQITSL